METRGLIVVAVWICITVLSAVIIWVSKQLDLWTALFILLLLGAAFGITFAIPFGLQEVKQPATRIEGQMVRMSKQLEELNEKLDYIKKQLEE